MSTGKVLLIAALSIAALLPMLLLPQPTVLSGWQGQVALAQRGSGITGEAAAITGEAAPVPPAAGGVALLEAYNQSSALQESAAGGSVRYFQRPVGGGLLAYFVVLLDDRASVRVVNADGATPASDATGDTTWEGGGKHLATVQEMAGAPYAALPDHTLLGATNFGFFGARTSSEGTVVIDGDIKRVNPGRAALCVTADRRAEIGKFSAADLEAKGCEQAAGAGPVFLWRGKIANPDVREETAEFLPFNPLGEDFAQLDWRITAYATDIPKTSVCVGPAEGGRSFLVLATSYGVPGVELARNMLAMGCTDAMGADDDTSTQMVWRGAPVTGRPPREVPDALAVYGRE
ncbi:MAG: hypothetical protein RLZZ387_187 [Chloroflexota bacterium]|jgi:hypothetical protein